MVLGALAQKRLWGVRARVVSDSAEMRAADWARMARSDSRSGRIFSHLVCCTRWHGIDVSLGERIGWRCPRGYVFLRAACGFYMRVSSRGSQVRKHPYVRGVSDARIMISRHVFEKEGRNGCRFV